MYYTYVLKNPNNLFLYIGYTEDLTRRCKEHEKDKPNWKLVYFEAYYSKRDAQKRERQLKQYGSSLGHLRKRILNSLNEI